MKRGRIYFLAVALLIWVGLTACQSFHGVQPIKPRAAPPGPLAVVKSLQPTLQWKPSKELDAAYDLIIYEEDPSKRVAFLSSRENAQSIGKRIYYREELKEAEHKLEEPLKPGTIYYWTVRARHNDEVSDWSHYDFTPISPLSNREINLLFSFMTPGE